MTMGVTPQALAARIFSAKPPAAPVSLVTRYRQSSIRSMASLTASVKGPCMQMRWLPVKPSPKAISVEAGRGSTRA